MCPPGDGKGCDVSRDAVKKFYEKVEADKALKAKLEAVGLGRLDEVVRIAGAAGFVFSSDDLVAFQQENSGELSEADLDLVAGGRINTPCLEAYCGVGSYNK
jgi:predicted ribosomally synthesized peptide with nif11-like leader